MSDPADRLRDVLHGGDRRSPGRAADAAALARGDPAVRDALWTLMQDRDRLVAMRAADAVEKLSAAAPETLIPFKRRLLARLREEAPPEILWHLLQMFTRLDFTARARSDLCSHIESFLAHPSRIVQACAVSALHHLGTASSEGAARWKARLETLAAQGPAAVRARARRHLRELTRTRTRTSSPTGRP